MSDAWGIRSREHTFGTGRSATLRESLPVTELVRQGVFDDETLATLDELAAGEVKNARAALRLSDAICIGMFTDPRLALPDANGAVPEGFVPIGVLDEEEIGEVLDLALASIAGAAGFRDDGDGDRDRGDSASVGEPAERPRRPAAGKPRGARPRSASRRKAR